MDTALTRRALAAAALSGVVGYAITRDRAVSRLCSRPGAVPRRADSLTPEPRGDGLILKADVRDRFAAEFRLNGVGAFIWLCADGRHSFGDIASKLSSVYGVSRSRASVDTARFLAELQDKGLIGMS